MKKQWETEFDDKFGNYGVVSTKELGMLEEEIKFRLEIKSFIEQAILTEKKRIENIMVKVMDKHKDCCGRKALKELLRAI